MAKKVGSRVFAPADGRPDPEGKYTLLNRYAAIDLLAELGYDMPYMTLAQLDHRHQGPIQTRFGNEIWYSMFNLRDWLEQRLNATIRQAVERGRLRIPEHLRHLRWDEDDSPVFPDAAEAA